MLFRSRILQNVVLISQHPPLHQLAAAGAEIDFKDILSCHADLKAYLNLRDNSDLYAQIRGTERLGIPCFVKEDGTTTLNLAEVLK